MSRILAQIPTQPDARRKENTVDIITEPVGSKETPLISGLLKLGWERIANAVAVVAVIFSLPFCFFNEQKARERSYDKDVRDIL